jgi:hypothetical protein
MTKYEIMTDHFEFRLGTQKWRIPSMSADEIFDTYQSRDGRITSNFINPRLCGSYATLEEAQAALHDGAYSAETRLQKGQVEWLLTGELVWIEENEYDDDGEFDQQNGFHDVLAEPYEKEEEVSE